MGKIFEALEHARERSGRVEPLPRVAAIPPPPVTALIGGVNLEEEMGRLHQNLTGLLPSAKRVIQFIGARTGEGTSTIAREFARVSATRFGQRVLLLESGPGSGYVLDGRPLAVSPSQIGGGKLYTAPLPAFSASPSSNGNGGGPTADAFFEGLRQSYDLVVVDTPPATACADGLAVCAKADGAVLVLEAEETRWPVAQSVKDAMVRSGGKVLGVVLNKRRYYIPDWVYRRL